MLLRRRSRSLPGCARPSASSQGTQSLIQEVSTLPSSMAALQLLDPLRYRSFCTAAELKTDHMQKYITYQGRICNCFNPESALGLLTINTVVYTYGKLCCGRCRPLLSMRQILEARHRRRSRWLKAMTSPAKRLNQEAQALQNHPQFLDSQRQLLATSLNQNPRPTQARQMPRLK